MTLRFRFGRLACQFVLGASCAALLVLLRDEIWSGSVDKTWSLTLIVPYAIVSVAWVTHFEAFTSAQRTALLVSCLAVCALLPRAMTGGLGEFSLPVIVIGPSLPFLVAWGCRLLSATEAEALLIDPSPTLSALLRGKRLRAAASRPVRKPLDVRDQFDEPLF